MNILIMKMHSHPTYEELKQTYLQGRNVGTKDSHPTYEELKLQAMNTSGD